jgi:hypothetical protein
MTFKSVILFFPTAISLLVSLLTFVIGVALDLVGLRRISQVSLRISVCVFSFVFLPLSLQSGLFAHFQGRQGGSPVA